MKKYLIIFGYVAIIAVLYYYRADLKFVLGGMERDIEAPHAVTAAQLKQNPKKFSIPDVKKTPMNAPAAPTPMQSFPPNFNLQIPFTSQAPHANWDLPYQEACEEASSLMARWFVDGLTTVTADRADKEILATVDWENATFGTYEDTTAAQVLTMLHDHFNLSGAYLLQNPTPEQIKLAVSQGFPVLVPASGKQLGNPNFRNGGPKYHMYVIRGYTPTTFITNDPGTHNGKNYSYTIENVMHSMHDWNGGDVVNGKKVVIVVKY